MVSGKTYQTYKDGTVHKGGMWSIDGTNCLDYKLDRVYLKAACFSAAWTKALRLTLGLVIHREAIQL